MRILKAEDVAILNRIADTQPTQILSCCDLFADLLPQNKSAILVDDHAYLLTAKGLEKEVFYANLLKAISLIIEARDEGFVYLIPSFSQSQFLIQQQISREVFIDKGASKCDIGVITHLSDEIIKVEGELFYQGFALPKTIHSIITSGVYCTEKLRKLKRDKFQTEEEQRYKKELKLTRIGLGISLFALFFSLASPFCMTEYNNRYAYSTMDTIQFKSIESNFDSIHKALSQKLISYEVDLNVDSCRVDTTNKKESVTR